MKIIEIQCNRWLLDKKVWGITLYPLIFYQKKKYRETLRRHEWEHVKQVREEGLIKFYKTYVWHLINKTPYLEIPYEVEAYKAESDGLKPWDSTTKK